MATLTECQTRYDNMSPEADYPYKCMSCDKECDEPEGELDEIDGFFYCHKCMGNILPCSDCGTDFHVSEIVEHQGSLFCNDCYDEVRT